MNTVETISDNLNIGDILFERIFQIIGEDDDELELSNKIEKESYPNLFYIVKSYIENMNSLKEIYKKIMKSNELKDYEKKKIENIYNLLFQDKFFLTYIQYVFTKDGETIKDLKELDNQLGKQGYIDLLTYGNLLYCYRENGINWKQLKDINKDISIKIELEKNFSLEYKIEDNIDYPSLFQQDINGMKQFFQENDNSKIDLSEKVMYIDKNDTSEYIKSKTRYDLMYALGAELRNQLNSEFNENGFTNIILDINRKWFNLNTSQIMNSIQEECNSLLQLVNSTNSITEAADYNKELGNLEEIIKEINFSEDQIDLIKTKLIPFIEEYVNTLVALQGNNFKIEEEMKEIFEEIIRKGMEVDKMLESEGIYKLSTKLELISILKKNIEKEILQKSIYENILSENYIIVYSQIMEYIKVFGEDNNIKLIKNHINIENIINVKIELLFQKLNIFENPNSIIEELKTIQSKLNNFGENTEIYQKLSDILEFLEGKIKIGQDNLGEDENLSKINNNYIKSKLIKWLEKIEINIELALDGNTESIDKLVAMKEFSFKINKSRGFLDTLEKIKNNKSNVIKTTMELEKYLDMNIENSFLIDSVRRSIENKKEELVTEIKRIVSGLDNTNTSEIGETIKKILLLKIWKEIPNTQIIMEINPEYLKYIGNELKKEGKNSKFLKIYKELFFRELNIENLLENREQLIELFENSSFGENLIKVYNSLKKEKKEHIIVLILEEYIITQDQKKIEKHLKDLFLS